MLALSLKKACFLKLTILGASKDLIYVSSINGAVKQIEIPLNGQQALLM